MQPGKMQIRAKKQVQRQKQMQVVRPKPVTKPMPVNDSTKLTIQAHQESFLARLFREIFDSIFGRIGSTKASVAAIDSVVGSVDSYKGALFSNDKNSTAYKSAIKNIEGQYNRIRYAIGMELDFRNTFFYRSFYTSESDEKSFPINNVEEYKKQLKIKGFQSFVYCFNQLKSLVNRNSGKTLQELRKDSQFVKELKFIENKLKFP